MRPALVTDSNSQLPADLRDRFDVHVVPVAVIINDHEFLEGVDLDADGFYAFFEDGATPQVSTSQPSPGAFIETYQRCIDAGHDQIVSVHVAEALSGTLNSARLAAEMVDVPVEFVDTQTASFGVACCVWSAGLVAESGGTAEAMADAARETAQHLYSVTALGAADLINASGRVHFDTDSAGVDLFATSPGGGFEALGAAMTEEQVCDMLAAAMHIDGTPIRVALGMADATALPYYDGLEARLKDRADVVEIVRYRIGPSVGAFTGPGTAGGFWYPA